MIDEASYSRKCTTDVGTAMAEALAAFLKALRFPGAGGRGVLQLNEVFAEWAEFEDQADPPCACVLPSGEITYEPGPSVPSLLEDTWEPPGKAGLGLYVLSEAATEMEVVLRADSQPGRSAIVRALEGALLEDPLGPPSAARYGVLVAMPGYWGLHARFALASSRKLDDVEAAASNRWLSSVTIRAQAPHVKLATVQPFRATITQEVGEAVRMPGET